MSNEKALVPVTRETWALIEEIAPVAFASRMFGVTKEQAMVVMLKGHELGLGLASAFEFIHVIDSKPSLAPKGALAMIHQSGELASLEIKDLTDSKGNPTRCKVTMKRKNGFEYATEFSMADAQRAGVIRDKSGWEKYPANMLRWRAIGYCADVVFPDVIGGMYRLEELGVDVNADGEPAESWKVVNDDSEEEKTLTQGVSKAIPADTEATTPKSPENAPETPQSAPEPKSEVEAKVEAGDNGNLDLSALVAKGYTPAQIMAANNGRIPGTSEECKAVLAKLEAENA